VTTINTQYKNWLDSLDDTVRKAYEERFGTELMPIFDILKVKWDSANTNDQLTDKMTDIIDVLDAELAALRAEAERLKTQDPAQQSLFPGGDPAKIKEAKEQELAERIMLVSLVQNEVTNKFHGVLSHNIPFTQIAELKEGRQEKIVSRDHTLTYNKYDKLLKISDGEGFDVFIAGLDAIAEVKSDGKKRLPKELRQTAAVLFDRMMIAAAEAGVSGQRGGFALRTYMAERGLSDEKSLRMQVERDLEILFGSKISWVGRGKNKDFMDLRILGNKGIKNGVVFYEFTTTFFEALMNDKGARLMYMQFPVALLRAANAKNNPWAYFLGRRAALHRHMNRGATNENIISVETLLSACPDFPTLEEVTSTTRDITRRMIEPFERDMDAQSAAYTWEYQGGQRPKTGKDFMAANVIISWKDCAELPGSSPAKKRITKKKAGGDN
jgi:hypothetical protein